MPAGTSWTSQIKPPGHWYTISAMHRGVLIAAVIAVLAVGAVFMLGGGKPEPAAEAPAAAPRIVPKKNEPVPTPAKPVDEPARKAAPKKTAPEPPPPPAAPAAPKLASLKLETDIQGASVFIDLKFVGNTPLSLDKLEPGSKRVQVTATGFESVQKTINLEPGPNAITIRVKEVSLNAKTT